MTSELPAVESTTEAELVTEKSGQENQIQRTGREEGKEDVEDAKGPIRTTTHQEVLKEGQNMRRAKHRRGPTAQTVRLVKKETKSIPKNFQRSRSQGRRLKSLMWK